MGEATRVRPLFLLPGLHRVLLPSPHLVAQPHSLTFWTSQELLGGGRCTPTFPFFQAALLALALASPEPLIGGRVWAWGQAASEGDARSAAQSCPPPGVGQWPPTCQPEACCRAREGAHAPLPVKKVASFPTCEPRQLGQVILSSRCRQEPPESPGFPSMGPHFLSPSPGTSGQASSVLKPA